MHTPHFPTSQRGARSLNGAKVTSLHQADTNFYPTASQKRSTVQTPLAPSPSFSFHRARGISFSPAGRKRNGGRIRPPPDRGNSPPPSQRAQNKAPRLGKKPSPRRGAKQSFPLRENTTTPPPARGNACFGGQSNHTPPRQRSTNHPPRRGAERSIHRVCRYCPRRRCAAAGDHRDF